MKKVLIFLFSFSLVMLLGAGEKPKYIFLFIGDGMSVPQRMIAEEFSLGTKRGSLAINHLRIHGTTRTRSANSLVTDSAASGTAIACGVKTNNGMLGVSPDGSALESTASAAKKSGKKVGILTTVNLNHATPGAFYAHRRNRGEYYAIILDLAASGFDYFAGGGFLKPEGKAGTPEYQGNASDVLTKAGYRMISSAQEFRALKPGTGKVVFPVCPGKMPYSLDQAPGEVTLAELTEKGIELLDNPKGFFMMIEGGAIDYGGHANDAAVNLHEVLSFDDAVKTALKFAEKHPAETLIVVTGDHETGGMTMGFASSGYRLSTENLACQKCSTDAFANELKKRKKEKKEFTFEDAKPLLTDKYGFLFPPVAQEKETSGIPLTEADVKELKKAYDADKLPIRAKQMIAAKAGVGWTTGAHTALPVLTTAQGCGEELFSGFYENTEIAQKLKTLLP